MEITTVGLDIAKRVLQLHGVDAAGKAVLRRKLQRDHRQLEEAHRGDTQLSRGWSLPRHKRPFVRSVPTIRANRRGRLLTEIAPPTV